MLELPNLPSAIAVIFLGSWIVPAFCVHLPSLSTSSLTFESRKFANTAVGHHWSCCIGCSCQSSACSLHAPFCCSFPPCCMFQVLEYSPHCIYLFFPRAQACPRACIIFRGRLEGPAPPSLGLSWDVAPQQLIPCLEIFMGLCIFSWAMLYSILPCPSQPSSAFICFFYILYFYIFLLVFKKAKNCSSTLHLQRAAKRQETSRQICASQ